MTEPELFGAWFMGGAMAYLLVVRTYVHEVRPRMRAAYLQGRLDRAAGTRAHDYFLDLPRLAYERGYQADGRKREAEERRQAKDASATKRRARRAERRNP